MRSRISLLLLVVAASGLFAEVGRGEEPARGSVKRADLGDNVTLETFYIPPGEFLMGSTPQEKKWATGIEGGATPGTERESYDGVQPRRTRVTEGFWMGRTEVSVGQFHRFVDEGRLYHRRGKA